METTQIKPKEREVPKNLNEVIAKIVEAIDVGHIYLNKGTEMHEFKYRLNIITKMTQNDMSEQIIPLVNSILQQYPDYTCRVFTFSYACSQLQQGNLYFLNYCKERDLVFKADDSQLMVLSDGELTKLYENSKKDFKEDMSRMKAFKKGFHYFREQKRLPQSAFMAHQTFEQGYRILEQFVCGRIKICHSIKNHQTYVLKSLNKLEGAFQIESDLDSKLLDLLEDAYSSARYTNNYNIGKHDIEQLSQKLGQFIKEVESWFNYELSIFQQNINEVNLNSSHQQTTKEITNPEEREFLFRKLEFDSPYEMLCLVKSLMVACTTCLQDDVEPPIQVNGFYFEINEVLQLAIRLLPLNETSP